MRRNGLLSEAVATRRFSLRDIFTSLKYPNYRLWFVGQLISLVGTWTQSTAQGYLIYQLTKSPAYLGYVSFASGLPSILFTLFAGAIADRVPRRTLMVVTQSCMMVLAFILAILTFTNVIQPWHILIMAFLLGTCNAFDAPARQAFILEMVDREDLTNAIALNSTMFNSALIVGPAIGGLIYASVGPGWCFTINGISFIAVIIALLLMKLQPCGPRLPMRSPIDDVKAGLKYVANHSAVRVLITNLFIITVFGFGIATLMPAWAVEVLHGDARTNGLLLAARGVGSLAGALTLAALGRISYRGKILTLSSLLLPVMMIVFATMRLLIPALIAMACVGFALMLVFNDTNAMVQTRIVDDMRGRVMGVYTFFFFGAIPLGSLLAGWSADIIGEPHTVIASAVILLVCSLIILWRVPALRAME
jgi:predicted MFS family arabinose efflux permease